MRKGIKIFLGASFVIVLILVVICFFFYLSLTKEPVTPKVRPIGSPSVSVKITLDNFEEVLSGNSMIKSLPDSSLIRLVLYEGEVEEVFLLSKGKVVKGDSDKTDISLSLPLRYLDDFNKRDFCDVIKDAKEKGDLSFSTSKSTTRLLWEYRSMLGYRKCLGF